MTVYVGTGKNPRIPEGHVVSIDPSNESQMSLVADGSVALAPEANTGMTLEDLAAAAVRGDFFSGVRNLPNEVIKASEAGLIDETGQSTPKAYDIVHQGPQPTAKESSVLEDAKRRQAQAEAIQSAQQPDGAKPADKSNKQVKATNALDKSAEANAKEAEKKAAEDADERGLGEAQPGNTGQVGRR